MAPRRPKKTGARSTTTTSTRRTTSCTSGTGSTPASAYGPAGASGGGSGSSSASTGGQNASVTIVTPNADLKDKLLKFGYTSDQADWMMTKGGLNDLANWDMITPENLSKIAKQTTRLTTNSFDINSVTMARTTAFLYWVQHQVLMGIAPDAIKLKDYDDAREREYICFY